MKFERAATKTEEGIKPRQGAFDLDDDLREMLPSGDAGKPKYPTGNELAETAAIMHALMNALQPLSIATLASSFAQGKAVEKRVAVTVQALARLSHITTTDDGQTFALMRL